jgi:hypothetical protein
MGELAFGDFYFGMRVEEHVLKNSPGLILLSRGEYTGRMPVLL